MYYTGVGSRETPTQWLTVFADLAARLSSQYGAVLRSGHADGADMSFEEGCNSVYGKKEIYIPWKGFNHSSSTLIVESVSAFEIAKSFTPYWDNLKDSVHKLFARNVHQVLGNDLCSKSDFLVCWTPDGKEVGGTRLAIAIAKANNVRVFNAGSYAYDYASFTEDVLQYAELIQQR